jgi:senataxin
MQKFDSMNIERIAKRLDHAGNILLRLEPEKRGLRALGQAEMFGLFEALSCEPFLRNEELLRKHLDEPFALVQTKRKLKPNSLLPAATEFLFSAVPIRYDWAVHCWSKAPSPLTRSEFDSTVRIALFRAMMRVQITNLDINFLPKFWSGVKMIVQHLNKGLVSRCLRSMECDIYKLALEHFQVDSEAFTDTTKTIQLLLEISPVDFWESMGSIAAPAIIDTIFNSPSLQRILLHATTETGSEEPPQIVRDSLAWIPPFLSSMKSSNQPPACRALIYQLLERFQSDKYSRPARSACFAMGLSALHQTLSALSEGSTRNLSPASIADALELVRKHLPTILQQTRGVKNEGPRPESAAIGLQVIEKALALDCLVLRMESDIIRKNGSLGSERHARSDEIWQKTIQAISSGDQALVSHALRGAHYLVGLERLVAKKHQTLSPDAKRFNESYSALCGQVGGILDRVNDKFSTFDMASLFKSPHLALGVVSAMLLSDDNTRQAAIDLLKSLSSEAARRDAILSVLKQSFNPTLSALNEIVRMVSLRRTYTPVANTLRFVTDVVDVLCDSQDGILRTHKCDNDEAKATQTFWERLWSLLATTFEYTEAWGDMGYPKNQLIEFCRDTMAFAERLFNQYNVFLDALTVEEGDKNNSNEVGNELLQQPKDVVTSMVKWLRLRDDYLATTIVALVTKLLRKLRDLNIMVSDKALEYLGGIIAKTIKAKLSGQQLAELDRAVEIHTGTTRTPPEMDQKALPVRKQSSMDAWISDSQKVVRDNSKAMEMFKEKFGQKKPSVSAPSTKSSWQVQKEQQAQLQKQRQAAIEDERKAQAANFLASRKAEKEARLKRDAEAIARARALRGETANQGSAIGTLGVKVKDHNAKGAGMMVSSEESSEDDDVDELDRELFGITKAVKRDKALDNFPFDTRVPQLLKKAPVKVTRVVRSVKDMRARLAPDLSKLHATILGWDYFHPEQLPPGSNPHQYSAVPDSFRDPHQYKQIFEPLLLLEAWQSFVNAREQTNSPYEVKIVSRGNVDALIEVSTQVSHADNKDQQLGEGDIVLISKSKKPTREDASCLARIHKINRKKQAVEVLYRVAPGNKLLPSLRPNVSLSAMKIQSITPLEREYGALQGLIYYDLCEYILRAEPSHLLSYGDKVLNPISDNYSLNKAQAKAVKSALDNDAFTLIQGPPGSGKTKTIVAIVGAILSDSLRDQGYAIQKPGAQGYTPAGNRAPAKKLLVCAPSNAAVDELVMRLKQGVRTMNGVERNINVVRLGRSDAINANVQDVTLDELVNAKLGISTKGANADPRAQTQNLMKEHQGVSEKLREARAQLDSGKLKGEDAVKNKDEFDALRKRKAELSMQIDAARDKEGAANRQQDLERKRAQQAVIDDAHVLCATLSGSGHDMFQNLNVEFETVIVDEAAQCVEMSVLIPMKYGCAKCILVGDPKQLPPTVFSREAAEFQYEQSLFVRMQRNHPDDVHLLDTQYRMHPEISLFPSATFYESRLLDGPDMAGLRKRPWHATDILGPYWFFDVAGQHRSIGHSLINRSEIELASRLYDRLMSSYSKQFDFRGKIGIITPYKSQLRELKSFFGSRYGREILDAVEFNTTDAFQGRESEIIIFSCVRASPSGGIGFLQDIRRMNVGLTRAKSSLWVLGNAATLQKGEFWGKLITDAKERDRFLDERAYATPIQNGMALQRQYKAMPDKPKPPPSVKTENGSSAVPTAPMNRAPTAPMMGNGAVKKEEERKPSIKVEKGYSTGGEDVEMTDAPSERSEPPSRPASTGPQATAMFGAMKPYRPPPQPKKRPPPADPSDKIFTKKKKPAPKQE